MSADLNIIKVFKLEMNFTILLLIYYFKNTFITIIIELMNIILLNRFY